MKTSVKSAVPFLKSAQWDECLVLSKRVQRAQRLSISRQKPGGASNFRNLLLAILGVVFFLPVDAAEGGVIFTNIFSFDGTNGTYPDGGLMLAKDGFFYGVTQGGGTNSSGYGRGTVFRIDTNGTLASLYSFGQILDTNGNPLDGGSPKCGLVQGNDGNLYGTTQSGGTNQNGIVFKLTASGALTILSEFDPSESEGNQPVAGLVQGNDGNFYGVADFGGVAEDNGFFIGYGTVFAISATGVFQTLHQFTGTNDGGNPYTSELVVGSDGDLYGTTLIRGAYYGGTVFKITTDGDFTTLYNFKGGNDGAQPKGSLVLGSDGNFYGTTQSGGTSGNGTLFTMTPSGSLTTLHSFTGGTDGAQPLAALGKGADGNFYGMTRFGGAYGNGVVFQTTPSGRMTILHSFTNQTEGGDPSGTALVQGPDGAFYGAAGDGGTYNLGTVFRLRVVPSPPPMIQSISQSNGAVTLSWSTEAGASHQVQYSSDLNSSSWTNLGEAVVASGTTLSATDIVGSIAQRFYRVALLQ